MERQHCDFDEARLIHTNRMFRKNGARFLRLCSPALWAALQRKSNGMNPEAELTLLGALPCL